MANVLFAIFGISLLMIVHEAGHYLMARAAGIRVLTFSIGFGAALVKFRPKGSPTTFKLCVIPFLAFVQMAGANPLEENDPNDDGLYTNKSLTARALTLVGGPLANYLFAAVVVFGLAMSGWREHVPTTPMVVDQVASGSPAASAGVRPGDVIEAIEGQPVRDVNAVIAVTGPRAGEPTSYLVKRGSESIAMTMTPIARGGRGTIGVSAKLATETRDLTVGQAAALAIKEPWKLSVENAKAIAGLLKHRSTDGLMGPVGMTKALAGVAGDGFYAFLLALVSISVGLGWFNLLPLPFLDGGRLLFLGAELVGGRRPNQTAEALVHAAGMLLFLCAAVAITWRDIAG